MEVVGVVVGLLAWFRVTPRVIARFLKKNRQAVTRIVELSFAVAFTLFYLLVFALIPVVAKTFNLAWAVLSAIMFWSLMGAWVPILLRRHWWTSRLNAAYLVSSYALVGFVLVGFWIVTWPDWWTAFVLTCFVLIFVIFLLVDRIFLRSKRAVSQKD